MYASKQNFQSNISHLEIFVLVEMNVTACESFGFVKWVHHLQFNKGCLACYINLISTVLPVFMGKYNWSLKSIKLVCLIAAETGTHVNFICVEIKFVL